MCSRGDNNLAAHISEVEYYLKVNKSTIYIFVENKA